MRDQRTPPLTLTAAVALVFAAVAYWYGLGTQHAMTNGDEALYAHIARRTAESGAWLPLRCDIPEMVDTKPPFIFWQAIMSTDRGRRWSLFDLRWPSLVWTGLTAALAARVAVRTGVGRGGGLLAAAVYLAFLGVFRYGRPFLTNPPEIFWTFLPCWLLIEFSPKAFSSRFLVPSIVGLCLGVALLAKSFVILAPAGLVLAVWHAEVRGWQIGPFVREALPGLAWTALLALAVFALWPLFDPEPDVIWRQFVVGENIGKLQADAPNYVAAFLWGRRSIWSLFGGWFLNAGLLAFPVAGTMLRGWQLRHTASQGERLLWLMCIGIFFFYCVPTQRSGRYLLDAMPALAVLVALHWHRLLRGAFMTTCVAALVIVTAVALLSVALARTVPGISIGVVHWGILLGGVAISMFPLLWPPWLPTLALPSVFAAYLALSGLAQLLDPPAGGFDAKAVAAAQGRVVWVPENFWAASERERMLLPGARVRGFSNAAPGPDPNQVGPDDLVLVYGGLDEPPPPSALGRRLAMGSRFSAADFRRMLDEGFARKLFRFEWLVPAASVAEKSG